MLNEGEQKFNWCLLSNLTFTKKKKDFNLKEWKSNGGMENVDWNHGLDWVTPDFGLEGPTALSA